VIELTEALKGQATELGFDLVGVAEAGPAPGRNRLRQWLAAGRHGDMEYMARSAHVRADPRLLLDGCRAVVAVALSYHTSQPLSHKLTSPDRVWVSRYAWGRDYHRLLKRRLVRLGHWLQQRVPTCAWRACVDTAPVLERSWAATAGLGWIGKNTCLINRYFGSELFLGVLLVDLALVPDEPASDHCGRCQACLEACPGHALVGDRELDARRCIAYLTVEHPGEITGDRQRTMGRMIAGCDVCQEVCPWNRRARVDLHPEFAPHPSRLAPSLSVLESLSEEDYRTWRQGSPLNRIPFPRFRRNLGIARSNLEGASEAEHGQQQ
jgi:epoxyqueuosine reductase